MSKVPNPDPKRVEQMARHMREASRPEVWAIERVRVAMGHTGPALVLRDVAEVLAALDMVRAGTDGERELHPDVSGIPHEGWSVTGREPRP